MTFIRPVLLMIVLLACLQACGADKSGESTAAGEPLTYKIYFLAGQSNMDGHGKVKELQPDMNAPVEGVYIFEGRMREDGRSNAGVGLWQVLEPGFGTGFSTNGKRNRLSDRFGPELSFGRRMQVLQPDENIAIIKYARGGTALVHGISSYGSWDPDYSEENGQNQYDHALATLRNAFEASDINGDGVTDRLVPAGIVWMQGEADAAGGRQAAVNYERNLRRMMDLLRAALRTDDLPLVIGRIKDSGDTPETRVMEFSPEVRAQQQAFVEADPCAALVTVTDSFRFLPDGWHYLSEDYVTLGEAFAEEMAALEQRC